MKTFFNKTVTLMLILMLSVLLPAIPAMADDAGDGSGSTLVDPVSGWGAYDALIDQIRIEADPAVRVELLHQAEDMLMATGCIIPVNYYTTGYLMQENVSGIYADSRGNLCLIDAQSAEPSEMLTSCPGFELYSVDPMLGTSSSDFTAITNLFSGLYAYNADGNLVPACAKDFPVTEDGHLYTVTLKEGLKWSDGTDLTAYDFEYAWKRAVNGFADYSYLFDMLDENLYEDPSNLQMSAVDGRTLTFVVTGSRSPANIADLMTMPIFYPVPSAYVEANSSADDPGMWCTSAGFPTNGAYVPTEFSIEEGRMVVEKNPYWYDADRVAMENQTFLFRSDEDGTLVNAFLDGSLACLSLEALLDISSIQEMQANQDPKLHIQPILGTNYMCMNCKSPLFEGKTPEQAAAMRQALSLLFNRVKYIASEPNSISIPANSYIPPVMSDGNGSLFETEGYYDPDQINTDPETVLAQARTLLESAGYVFDEAGMLSADTPMVFEMKVNDGTRNLAEQFHNDLAALGIQMDVVVEDWATLSESRNSGNFNIIRAGWICDSNDPLEMLANMTSDSYNNYCLFGAQ